MWLDETRSTERTFEAGRRRGRSLTDVCGEWMMSGYQVHAEWTDGGVLGRIVAAGGDLVVVDDSRAVWGLQAALVSTWDRTGEARMPFGGVRMWPTWDAWVSFVEMSEAPVALHIVDGQTRRGHRIEQGRDHVTVHHGDGSETMTHTDRVVSLAVLDRDAFTSW